MNPYLIAGLALLVVLVPVVLRVRLDRARDVALLAWARVDYALGQRAAAALEASGGAGAVAAAADAADHARTIPAQAVAQQTLVSAVGSLGAETLAAPALVAADQRVADATSQYTQARARYEARRRGPLGRLVSERLPVLEPFPDTRLTTAGVS